MHISAFRSAATVAIALAAPVFASAPAHAATPAGKIVFTRSTAGTDITRGSRSLWLLDLAGGQVRQLTMPSDRTFDATATWSPDGSTLVFDRGTTRPRMETRYQLEAMSPDTQARAHPLVSGVGDFSKPAWGPGDRVAYITTRPRGGVCVSLTDAQGRTRRELFCAAPNTQLMRPMWSGDGKQLFVSGGYFEGRLEPVWHAQAWRIDVATANTTRISDIVMDEPLDLQFSPDGTHGIYSDIVANDMTLVDFRDGAITALPRGHAPMWSPDGRRIAYTGEVYEVGAQFRYYEPLYVMDAVGTHARRITASRVDNHAYTAAQWSKDGVHLLVNRRTFDDVSLTIARFGMRIVDVDTRVLITLPAGYAEAGGWYEP